MTSIFKGDINILRC